jgi:retron-type reverse transcriptase
MSTETNRLSELAKEDPKRQFFSIAHLITPEKMYAAFLSLRKDASAGVDGVTYKEYEKDAARNIRELHQRLKDGKYRAQPLRRVYIPKENGKQRPISIPALEDKLVQKVMVEILRDGDNSFGLMGPRTRVRETANQLARNLIGALQNPKSRQAGKRPRRNYGRIISLLGLGQ